MQPKQVQVVVDDLRADRRGDHKARIPRATRTCFVHFGAPQRQTNKAQTAGIQSWSCNKPFEVAFSKAVSEPRRPDRPGIPDPRQLEKLVEVFERSLLKLRKAPERLCAVPLSLAVWVDESAVHLRRHLHLVKANCSQPLSIECIV